MPCGDCLSDLDCRSSVGFPDGSADLRMQLRTFLPPGPLWILPSSQYLTESRPTNICGWREKETEDGVIKGGREGMLMDG